MQAWREENGISPEEMADTLGITPIDLLAFEGGAGPQINRRRGEEIERKTGMNRKWLMYGDGRSKGKPRIQPAHKAEAKTKNLREDRNPAPNKRDGQRVKEARKAAGLTREQLAEMMNLSVSRVAQMESGYIREQKAEQILHRIASMEEKEGEESPKDAGIRLRNARKEAGLSVKEAAEIMGVKHTTLAHLESGYVTPKHADELIGKLQAVPARTETAAFDPKEAGARIREERIKAGLSQKELSTILHVPAARISHAELGSVTEQEAENILRRIHGKPSREIVNRKIKPKDQVILGSKIRDTRMRIGLSQKALGEIMQFPQTKVSLIEKGKVDEPTAKKILAALEAYEEAQAKEAAAEAARLESARQGTEAGGERAGTGKEPRKDLGEQIRKARMAAGLSQKAVAELLGVSQGSVSYMEQGRINEENAEKVIAILEENRKA